MCGIAGIVDFTNKYDRIPVMRNMLSVMAYRGPDESGMYNSPYASIGNLRLSIVDIEGGQQPLCDQTGRYWIVFNGEIFNYPELREDLLAKGCLFATHSDTEVLVQLYATYGSKCLGMLNGQFAFAIWDKINEELFLARDRVGIRPLFYTVSGNGNFSFASEIKSLFEQKEIIPELNPESLSQIFTFWAALTPNTAFKNIFELSPGEFMIYSRNGVKKEKYWELTFGNVDSEMSIKDAVDKFDEIFSDAVRIRLRADVEVAAYLSGGLDSSATVAYINEIEPTVLNTFSVGFEEEDFDESSFQKEAVRYFNTSHKSIVCTSDEIANAFPKVVWHLETPVMRTAPIPMYLLSKLVRENGIKVVITGEGSDEILAGYNIFKETKIRRFWANQPGSSARPLLLKKLYPYLPQMKSANPAILKMFFGYKLDDVNNPFYSHLLRWNNSNHITKHLSAKLKEDIGEYSPFDTLAARLPENFNAWDSVEKAQWLEITMFMSGYLLSSQGDRMALANSVEGRYPFLDYRLIEFCAKLPARFKLNSLNEKFLLKKLMRNRIPDSITNRSKQAYRAPIQSVFLSKQAPEYVKRMLSADFTDKVGVFNSSSLQAVLARIEKTGTSTEVENMLLTFVISTHLLYDQFINKNTGNYKPAELSDLKIINDL
jgi:asparagine synthase (glutamine-hydrolysing)